MAFGTGSSTSRKMKEAIICDSLDARAVQAKSLLGANVPEFKNKLRVLVVDDNKVNRKVLIAMLKKLKVESKEAVNGKEALDLFVAGEVFHLVLIDMEMPVMSGPEATKKLRSMGVRVKIVGVSGHSTNKEKEEFLKAGADEFHIKPTTFSKLIALLHEVDGKL